MRLSKRSSPALAPAVHFQVIPIFAPKIVVCPAVGTAVASRSAKTIPKSHPSRKTTLSEIDALHKSAVGYFCVGEVPKEGHSLAQRGTGAVGSYSAGTFRGHSSTGFD